MVYLESFQPYMENRNVYPYRTIYPMQIESINFAPITIFYGSNGCGKSTMLNVIADQLGIRKKSMGNTNEYFSSYVRKCTSEKNWHKPEVMELIRSEDIMKLIVDNRQRYKEALETEPWTEIKKHIEIDSDMYERLLYDPDEVTPEERFLMSRMKDISYVVSNIYAANSELASNGEKALEYFKEKLFPDSLYLLDEPENSMAPAYQQELATIIMQLAHLCNTQFIIATHSPFMLSMDNAKIYDIDSKPSYVKEWYELENMKTYYNLFKRNEKLFNR